ncbi:hypothetical protein PVK06_011331 [Gossypium arboreum]|uniref:Uncharacterized protein n=1 Tax=Gossypium arboreum TaxID=29729 RepID=A0ABR0Q994_GOSAR|nr:hypothetical protein PVK06_011331 [Gossypium arboreum]
MIRGRLELAGHCFAAVPARPPIALLRRATVAPDPAGHRWFVSSSSLPPRYFATATARRQSAQPTIPASSRPAHYFSVTIRSSRCQKLKHFELWDDQTCQYK